MKPLLIAVLMLSALSCTNPWKGSSRDNSHSHEQGSTRESYTLYSDSLEFFVVHSAMEAGKESEFLIHVTRLSDHSPLSAGTLNLQLGDQVVSVKAPASPGIYHVHMDAPGAGTADFRISVQSPDLMDEVHGHAHVYADHQALHDAVDQGHLHGAQGEVSFLKEQAWTSDFLVEKAEIGPFHTVIPTSGEFMPMPGEKSNIVATTRGMVHFHDPRLVQGARVHQGQVLFGIRSESLVEDNMRVRYEAARNRLESSRTVYLRHQRLIEQEAISEKKYLESKSKYVEDSLNYHMLEAHVKEGSVRISAPASGSLHELAVSSGQYVNEGSVLAILSPDRNLMLRADLPQQYFAHSKEIQSAHFRSAYSDRVIPVESLGGTLLSVGHSVKENDHYLPVVFMLENDGSILEGAFAEVYLIAGEREEVLSVPVSALGEEQGGHYVYVQVSGESYSKRRVTTGPGDGIRIEITGGLEAGERIVSRGLSLVRAAAMNTGEIGHGHTH